MSWLLINRKWHFKRSDLSSVAHRLEPGLLPRYLPDSMSAWRRLSKTNHQSGQQAPVWSDQGKKINKIKIKNPGEKKKKKLPKTVETISGNCSEKTASRSFFSLPPQSPQSRSRAQLWRNWRLCWKLLSDARSLARPPAVFLACSLVVSQTVAHTQTADDFTSGGASDVSRKWWRCPLVRRQRSSDYSRVMWGGGGSHCPLVDNLSSAQGFFFLSTYLN